jgi:dGTPase
MSLSDDELQHLKRRSEDEDRLTKQFCLEERLGTNDPTRKGDSRRPYDRDYSRILHSSSFRRLQGKTQVLSVGHSDFYRTRLTHSLEAAQIGRGIAHHLRRLSRELDHLVPPRSLIEASALAHDLGHPPFGHFGERVLNQLMHLHGGFEGNGQTLRILTRLESGAPSNGLNLTRRMLLAVLKYPVAYTDSLSARGYDEAGITTGVSARAGLKPPKCYFDDEKPVVDWMLEPFSDAERDWMRELSVTQDAGQLAKPKNKTLDATVMELADDIAYGVHDLEDAVRMERIRREDLEDGEFGIAAKLDEALEGRESNGGEVLKLLASGEPGKCKQAIGRLVNVFVTSVRFAENDPKRGAGLQCGLLVYRAELPRPQRVLLTALTQLVWKRVIAQPVLRQLESRGAYMIHGVWDVLRGMPTDLLPSQHRERWARCNGTSRDEMRVLSDYVAGMTDGYLTQLYERLFQPHHGSPFDVQ